MRVPLRWAEEQVGPVEVVRPLVGGLVSTTLLLRSGRGELVLRVLDRGPGRAEAPARLPVEVAVLRALQGSGLPVPEPVAVDPTGERAEVPVLLTTRLPGVLRLDPLGPAAVRAVAEALVRLHALTPPSAVLPFSLFWSPDRLAVPPRGNAAWASAIQMLREDPPAFRPVLLHRDVHPGNLLWDGDRLSGVVDWAGACLGPAALDVAHCATNLALLHGPEAAEALRDAYEAAGGRMGERAAWWDLADVLGLPDPGALAPPWRALGRTDLDDELLRRRLDAYVRQRARAM